MTPQTQNPESSIQNPDAPPVFKKWSHWYWLLLIALLMQILLFYYVTTSFA